MNPVRAHFLERAEYYVWSSARAHISAIKDDILSAEGWLQERELNAYREFLEVEGREIEASIGSRHLVQEGETAKKETLKNMGGVLNYFLLTLP